MGTAPWLSARTPGTTKSEFAEATEPSVLEYQAHSAPIGVAVSADGNLLFTDDANGVMYCVSYAP